MRGSFESQLSEWARQSQARALAVVKDATQIVANEMRRPKGAGGNMPVDTGNLRRSVGVSKSEMPSIKDRKTKFNTDPGGEITLTIAGMQVGDTIYLGFQAVYARVQENLNGFVRLTAQRWPEFVAASCRRLQGRVEGRGRG